MVAPHPLNEVPRGFDDGPTDRWKKHRRQGRRHHAELAEQIRIDADRHLNPRRLERVGGLALLLVAGQDCGLDLGGRGCHLSRGIGLGDTTALLCHYCLSRTRDSTSLVD